MPLALYLLPAAERNLLQWNPHDYCGFLRLYEVKKIAFALGTQHPQRTGEKDPDLQELQKK